MLISIDDAVCRKYLAAVTASKIPLEKLLERQLARFATTPITQRVLALTGEELQQIETALGVGSTKDPATLLAAIHAFAGLTIGGIRVDFSPSQLDELALRAEKQGRPVQDLVEDVVQQMARNFFYEAVPTR